jgi:hypothetical protein
MQPPLPVIALALSVCAAFGQTRSSSRNLQPLTKRPAAETPAPPAAAPAREPPAGTVTTFTFLGPKTGWGVVKATSPYYAPDGKRLGTLPGGTLFTYDGVKSTSKNAVLVSTVKRGKAWEGPYLLDCTDIAGYEGDPDALNPALVNSLAAYFTLNGKIADRKAALEEETSAANPHLEAARQAQQAYQASIGRAAEMERQMNAQTGLQREKTLDALRALKYEQARLKAKADQTAAACKAWKDANPPDPARLAADPQLRILEKEREAARAPVAALIPVEN